MTGGIHDVERQKDLAAIERLMGEPWGRRLAHRFLTISGYLDEPKPPVNITAETVAFLEGRRSVGHILFSDIMLSAPKKFMVMVLEAKEREQVLIEILKKEQGNRNDE